MAERKRIIRQWRQDAAEVLVTLVRAEGSSYRRVGAHMLIGPDGECSGSVSGGCLEAEIVRKAAWMVRFGAVVESYSTLFDDTAEIPYGLGCGGVVDLLLEPSHTSECQAFLDAMEGSLAGTESHIATWLPGEGGLLRRAIFATDRRTIFASDGLSAEKIETARTAIRDARSAREVIAGDERMYFESLAAPQRLVILGAGEDVKPVVTMAALLGWRVVVADGRTQLARAERFPEAEQVIAVQSMAELDVRTSDAVVLMTHSYEQDRALLTQLLAPLRQSSQAASCEISCYIGLLGAAHRGSLLIAEAAASLGVSLAECCAHVWAPVGLDLGGDGAEAIALAIIAEVQAWREGRLLSSRRLTAEQVAEHIAQGGSLRYLQAQCSMGTLDMAAK